MPRTLGGAEFDPDEGFTVEYLMRQAFGDAKERDLLVRAIRVASAVPFVGAPCMQEYPVNLLEPN